MKKTHGLKSSSRQWLARQLNDPYVHAAKAKGYRSRAAFKLVELDGKFHFLKKGARILDLLPEDRHKTYDVRGIIACIADAGSGLELKPRFGRSICSACQPARFGPSISFLESSPTLRIEPGWIRRLSTTCR